MTLIHATCVALGDTGVLIRGPSGAGKSDLALRLIDGGARLVSDDYCDLSVEDTELLARTPDTIAGKMEVRGLGVMALNYQPMTRVGLVVDLMPKEDIERLPDSLTCTIDGVTLARIAVDPDTPSAAAKVRMAANRLPVISAADSDENLSA